MQLRSLLLWSREVERKKRDGVTVSTTGTFGLGSFAPTGEAIEIARQLRERAERTIRPKK